MGHIHAWLCMSKETLGFYISRRVLNHALAHPILGHSTRVSSCLHSHEMWSGALHLTGGFLSSQKEGNWRENLSVVG